MRAHSWPRRPSRGPHPLLLPSALIVASLLAIYVVTAGVYAGLLSIMVAAKDDTHVVEYIFGAIGLAAFAAVGYMLYKGDQARKAVAAAAVADRERAQAELLDGGMA